MTRDELLSLSDEALAAQCEITACCGSGPGGQKRNRTATAVRVVLKCGLGEWVTTDCTGRSFFRNRDKALRKLRLAVAFSCRESGIRLPERLDCSVSHADYPLYAARVMDILNACGFDHKAAAEMLGTTPTGLLKKIARDPHFWQTLNRERANHGLAPLRMP